MYENELYHHGVKGQRWGIRRFQNKDGSLTRLGQKRADSAQKKAAKAEQKKAKQAARAAKIAQGKENVKALFKVKSTSNQSGNQVGQSTNENNLNERFRSMTGYNSKSAGRGGVSELTGLASIAGVVGGGMALGNINNSKLSKPEEFKGEKPVRPVMPEDVLTNESAMKDWNKERGVYDKMLKDYNADKSEYDAKMNKYKEAMNARFDLAKSSLEATKNVSSNVVRMMENANRQKAEKLASSLDLSSISTKELRDYVDRYNAEQSFRRVSAEQMNSGRSKTMEILETIGAVASVGASVAGAYAAYKKIKG